MKWRRALRGEEPNAIDASDNLNYSLRHDLKDVAEDFVRDLPVLCGVGVGFAQPRSSFGRKALQ
ncbi:hypothetical protein X734_26770 [Mesorhizobium sp. L2C084A000]|nr:hypothetical protein X734_26770 [Mesorhizobium sp. L2C084A000]